MKVILIPENDELVHIKDIGSEKDLGNFLIFNLSIFCTSGKIKVVDGSKDRLVFFSTTRSLEEDNGS